MPSTHAALHYHLVFSTKNREPWFEPHLRSRLHEYLGGILRTENGIPHAIGGTGDHVHLLAGLRPTHCLADILQRVKSISSRWIHEELRLAGFAWQEGYGAFTVSVSSLEKVRAYVLNQEAHHRVKTFQEEYVEMLQRGLVEYNEAHLW
ncbi:REP element-mobilizing transposase RayT [Prosthecobacter fusiformis]|uniref:REP element-mobilizing transposase RayT n=1 Tax=Prosthecobacter fusiformis TaxID=48464 RepID=A0A4R7RJG8_9BACT|nr:IS200/IS605 family transposase [Prosthecobacter fusiformis]TDU64231.1 REP element-mobilizing transposase RayT [Prosthecobacter fusiformis]